MIDSRLQNTIAHPVAVCGYGFWSGKAVQVEFRPAPVGSGLYFVREDLEGNVRVPAKVEHRIDIPRRSNLELAGVHVEMVEHILAALAGLQIDNCEIAVDAAEMPGCDGSSLAFIQAIDAAGVVQQSSPMQQIVVTEAVRVEHGESWIEATPSASGEYFVEFQLDYPDDPVIGRQTAALTVTPDSFRTQLAPCRTFVLEREAEALLEQGLGKHVSPNDLLLFGKFGPVDNRLRFDNECARHKALDLVGDLALTGYGIVGEVRAYRSSHHLNAALASELVSRFANLAPLKASA